jgi:hypothetical protein
VCATLGIVRSWAFAALLLIGCYRSHSLYDAGPEPDVGSVTTVCVTPGAGHCCCSGDVTDDPICAGDHWECRTGFGYHEGFECSPSCGGPCSQPCLFDAGAPDVVLCTAAPPVFPSFDRQCNIDSDCALARHQTDCCGSIHVMGISSYEQARFDGAEARCEAQYPECMCIGNEFADDMTTPASGPMPYVRCTLGVCTSSFFLGG